MAYNFFVIKHNKTIMNYCRHNITFARSYTNIPNLLQLMRIIKCDTRLKTQNTHLIEIECNIIILFKSGYKIELVPIYYLQGRRCLNIMSKSTEISNDIITVSGFIEMKMHLFWILSRALLLFIRCHYVAKIYLCIKGKTLNFHNNVHI